MRQTQVLQWLSANEPDILALQEIKQTDASVDAEAFRRIGYRIETAGEPRYNGVALVSRLPLTDLVTDLGTPGTDPQRRLIAGTWCGVRVVSIYAPNGESPDSAKYAYKLDWFRRLGTFLRGELRRYQRVLVAGDFNVAPTDDDVHDIDAWRGGVLISEPERAAFRDLLTLGFHDMMAECAAEPHAFTWWDYRARAFQRGAGLRIDHILASEPMLRHCAHTAVDIETRRADRPSDHAVVHAEFVLA